MAQPLYFLPGLKRASLLPDGNKLTRSLLESRGIREAFSDVAGKSDCFIGDILGSGPGGKSGCVLCYQTPDGALPENTGYRPDSQEWHEVNDDLWIGIDTTSPPTPDDLARPRQHNGYLLVLDGQSVHVPIIRRPDGSSELPRDLYWDAAGKLAESVKKAYAAYWEETALVSDWFFAKGFDSPTFDLGKAMALAVRAVGINYRYSRIEHNLLRWIDSTNWSTVLSAAVDGPNAMAIETAEKKSELSSELEPSAITDGSTDEITNTDQAAATST
jgi:hypothetical protein